MPTGEKMYLGGEFFVSSDTTVVDKNVWNFPGYHDGNMENLKFVK